MTKLIVGKKYKINWCDIHSYAEWKSREDILKSPETIISGVYFYLGRGKGGVCFAAEFNGTDYGNVTIMPKSVIRKISIIK